MAFSLCPNIAMRMGSKFCGNRQKEVLLTALGEIDTRQRLEKEGLPCIIGPWKFR